MFVYSPNIIIHVQRGGERGDDPPLAFVVLLWTPPLAWKIVPLLRVKKVGLYPPEHFEYPYPWPPLISKKNFCRSTANMSYVFVNPNIWSHGESGASAWDESIGFLIKCIMIDLILHEFKIIQDQWISFEIWTLNPWFCEVNYYFKYMAEECFMPVLAKLSVCDGKNGITMYCVFQ